MADEDDLKELRDGNPDLARRDLRNADLRKLDLSHRDFSHAHLEKADFSGSNLSSSNLDRINAAQSIGNDADLSFSVARATAFYAVTLKRVNFSNADFSGSHFTRCDFSGSDLRGADFRRAHLLEGTDFTDCIVDEATLFDDAEIFRPLARQPAFRFYVVERGTLKRKAPISAPKSKDSPETGIYRPEPQHFEGVHGTASFDFTDNDGRAIFGSAVSQFDTRWSDNGNGSIHAYINPPSVTGIAVASVREFAEINQQVIQGLSFSSQSRKLVSSEFLVARNREGQYIAFKILDVSSKSHGAARDELSVEFRILGKADKEFVRSEDNGSLVSSRNQVTEYLRNDIDALVKNLSEAASSIEDDTADSPKFGIGHNNPPVETPLDRKQVTDIVQLLKEIKSELSTGTVTDEKAIEAESTLLDHTKTILRWVSSKAEIVANEFSKELGKSLGNSNRLLVLWLTCSTQMGNVISSLAVWTSHFL